MSGRQAMAAITLLVISVAGCGRTDSTSDEGAGALSSDETTTTQATVEEPTTTATPAEARVDETTSTMEPIEEGPAPTCAYTGTDPDFGYMQVDLSFTNMLGEVVNPEVTYALLDGEGGTRFFTGSAGALDTVDIMFAAANEQFRLAVDTREDLPATIDEATITCSVLALEEGTEIDGFVSATGIDTCEVLGTDSSGRIEVDITATSPYGNTTTVQTWWALKAPGPVRFLTETNVDDLIGAGETFKVIPSFNAERPEWIGDDEVTCAVVGFWDQDIYNS